MRTDLRRHSGNVFARAAAGAFLAALLGASLAGAESVALTWTAPGDDGTVGRAATYDLRYSETPVSADTASWWASATPVASIPAPSTAGTSEIFVVVGLQPSRTYYFVIRAADEVPNWSGFSNVATKQTAGGGTVALATPTGFAANAIPGGVLLSWNAISMSTELGYRLYRKAIAEQAPTPLATLPLTSSSWSDTTALGGETYEYRVTTYSDSLESAPAIVAIAVPQDELLTSAGEIHGYPNPARGQVTLRFTVDASASNAPTRITVFDLTGRRICRLAEEVMTPGEHTIAWSCRSDRGNSIAPGLYNIILDGPSGRSVTRLAVVP